MARRYTGSAGKITNRQVGVFAALASRHGHAFIDRALHLPNAWTDDPARLAGAHVPDDAGFATRPRIAVRTIRRALAADVPFAWVAADTVYGMGGVEQVLRRAGTPTAAPSPTAGDARGNATARPSSPSPDAA